MMIAAQIMGAQRRSKFLGLRPPREFIRIRGGEMVAMGQPRVAGDYRRWAIRVEQCAVLLRKATRS